MLYTKSKKDIVQIQSEETLRLNAVIETATDAIITISDTGEIETVNHAVTQLFGYKKAEVIGQNVGILMPEPDRSLHDKYLLCYLKTKKAKIIGKGRDIEGRKKDGTVFPMRLSVSEVKLSDRIIFTGILHDLTQRKANETHIIELNEKLENRVQTRTEELESAIMKLLEVNQQLQNEIEERKLITEELEEKEAAVRVALQKEKELNSLKSRFMMMASHEFRTPLASIVSSAEIIGEYKNTEQQAKRERHIKRIFNAVTGLDAILHDFASLSSLEEGKLKIEAELFSLPDFCNQIFEDLKKILKLGQRIVHHKTEDLSNIYFDKKILKLILKNLISNASKYSEENSIINCTTSSENENLIIEISDNGIGIPLSDQKFLFTRFFRGGNVENIQGTGLGLNIIKKYLDMVEGNIKFTSKEEKGTTFTVSIPLQTKKHE